MQWVRTPRRRRCRNPGARASAGFTLIELVTVMVIMGVLAALTAPRFADQAAFQELGFYEEVAATLRYGQKIAVGSGCPVKVSINTGGYALAQQTALSNRCNAADTTWAVPVLLPDGQSATGSTPASVTLSPVITYQIDGLGKTDLSTDLTVSIGSRTLVVQAQSGYVLTP